jgi:hypothetical protein
LKAFRVLLSAAPAEVMMVTTPQRFTRFTVIAHLSWVRYLPNFGPLGLLFKEARPYHKSKPNLSLHHPQNHPHPSATARTFVKAALWD